MTWLTANPRYFTVPGSFTCAFTTIMGCRLILNLCRVYYNPNDATLQPQSIWAASEGVRFKPPASTTVDPNWTTDREASPPTSPTPGTLPAGSIYELSDLDGTKWRGEQ